MGGTVDPYADSARQYAEFAADAGDESPCFAAWARGVAADPDVLAWLAGLPGNKRQPNLVFAAARWHGVPAPGPYDGLRRGLLGDDGSIRRTILARATQTNEVGRLATLVPAFAQVSPCPLALIEVGASAGLNLFPDRYSYSWGAGSGPLLSTTVTGPAPLPAAVPEVAWRGGIDLNPLDVTDDDQMAWLSTLVWPEQDDRRDQLRRAIEVARTDPPAIVRGNLLEELPALVEQASAYGTVVVFHSAVIAYLVDEDRERFHDLMASLVADGACHWVSNEGPRVLPRVTATGPELPADLRGFVLGVDGRSVAWTHGHGRWLQWHS
ncbi:DUF2332 domain-containing protein [Nocardioides sp. CN2-186]|uniref:DUF2332 domain-containing protein n=1 Tax=Nocardioides tweenelious TaxID=3156607 RepID=UPI0032B33869